MDKDELIPIGRFAKPTDLMGNGQVLYDTL